MHRFAAPGIVLLALGCRHPVATAESGNQRITGCTFGERVQAVSEAIRNAELLDVGERAISAHVVDVCVGELVAEVTWEVSGRGALRTLVDLGATGQTDALRPVRVTPIVLEWPTREPAPSAHWMRVTVAPKCAAGAGGASTVITKLAPIDSTSCAAEARLTGGDTDWCVRSNRGLAWYEVREYRPVFRPHRVARVTVEAEATHVDLDGAVVVIPDGQAVHDLFEPIWHVSSEVDESCRHSALKVVEARRGNRWKTVLRHCEPAIDLERLATLARSSQ
jgi:hypothetical protein